MRLTVAEGMSRCPASVRALQRESPLAGAWQTVSTTGGRGGGGGGGRSMSRGGGGGRSSSRAGGMGGGGGRSVSSRPSVSGGGYRGGTRYSGGGQARTAQRPTGNRAGGLAPNKNIAGGNMNRSQVSSKIQSRPKGSGSALPSVAQGGKRGAGAGGDKGFPDVGGRTGAGQLAVASFRAPGAVRFPTGCRGASWVRSLGEHLLEARFRAVSGISVVAI
jgi:hypothetical protein